MKTSVQNVFALLAGTPLPCAFMVDLCSWALPALGLRQAALALASGGLISFENSQIEPCLPFIMGCLRASRLASGLWPPGPGKGLRQHSSPPVSPRVGRNQLGKGRVQMVSGRQLMDDTCAGLCAGGFRLC